MNHFILKTLLVISLLCFFTLQSFAGSNSFMKLLDALHLVRDNMNSYEQVEKRLSQIVPAACQIDETKISREEMEFLLTVFKLDCAVSLKKGKESLSYAQHLEKIIADNKVDYKKLSNFFEGRDMKFLSINNIAQAYIINNYPEEGIKRLQPALSQFPKGSYYYTMIRFGLGTAFLKMGKPELAVKPLKYAFDYFVKKNMKAYAAVAASNLSGVYLQLNNELQCQHYTREAMKYSEKNSTVVQCELALAKMIRLYNLPDCDIQKKNEFENARKYILTHSSSDLQIWGMHVFSTIFKSINAYSDTDILNDLEKAYTYRHLIWGDGEVGKSVELIEELLNELKKELFKKLAQNQKFETLNYWNTRFARKRQKKADLARSNKSAEQQKMLPLLALVSKYENTRQILTMEENKPKSKQNRKLILSAIANKRSIERQFESIKKQLSVTELKQFQNALDDEFIIPPNALKHLSEVMSSGTACVQCLPAGNDIIIYLTVKNAPPFATIIDLKKFNQTAKSFSGKLIKFRTLLQSGAPEHLLKKEAQGLYNIFFKDLEKSLHKLEVKKLVINASGILRYIPFGALYDGKQYLIEKYQVSSITGMDLIRLSKNPVKRNFRDIQVAIFANPDGTLPASQKEGISIANMFPKKQCYLGKAATLESFETLLGNINFVHLATHAVLNPDQPEFSYIQFADQRKWYYSDMRSLNIKNVDSIVLSACSTAVKPDSEGSEIESMAAQLLKNTTSGSIVASFWDVDDGATALFMKNYYQYILNSIQKNGSLDRGGAIQYAQLQLLRNKSTASPQYWAAFTLLGDFR